MKFPVEGEEAEEGVILEGEVIIEEGESLEEAGEGSVVEVEAEEIIEGLVVAVEVEIEVNTGEEEEAGESIEGVGEEDHPAEEVEVIEKERGHPMEETDMRVEEVHLQHRLIVERENIIEKKEEDHLREMDLPEDHHLQGTVMALLDETMEDPPHPGPPGDPMKAVDLVAAGMRRVTPAGVPHHHQGLTDTGAGAPWQAGTLLHTRVGLDQEKDILQVQAIQARTGALEQGEVNTEGELPVMREEEEEDTRIMREVTGGIVVKGVEEEEVPVDTNHHQELLLETTILHQEVKEEVMRKEVKGEVLLDTTVKVQEGLMNQCFQVDLMRIQN